MGLLKYNEIENIDTLYLLGSYVKDEAVPGISDIDIIAFTKDECDFETLRRLQEINLEIETKIGYPAHLQIYSKERLDKVNPLVLLAIYNDGQLIFGEDMKEKLFNQFRGSDWESIGKQDIERYYKEFIKSYVRAYPHNSNDRSRQRILLGIDYVYNLIRSTLIKNKITNVTKRKDFSALFKEGEIIEKINQIRENLDTAPQDFEEQLFKIIKRFKEGTFELK